MNKQKLLEGAVGKLRVNKNLQTGIGIGEYDLMLLMLRSEKRNLGENVSGIEV